MLNIEFSKIMINCLIVEDDFGFALETKIKAEEIGINVIAVATDFDQIKSALDKYTDIDVILSDVKLEDDKYAFDYFKTVTRCPPIIFFTAYQDKALYEQSKKVNPYICLSKPFTNRALLSAIEVAFSNNVEYKIIAREIL